jgi:flagellar biosynthetic protein FliO
MNASAALGASAPASGIPYLADEGAVGGLALRSGSALLLCLLLVGAVVYVLLRVRKTPFKALTAARRLEVMETRALSTRARLLVVRYEDRQLLLAHTENGVALLHEKAATSRNDPGAAA